MVIEPAIKKLAGNVVIPLALECDHSRCIKILAVIVTREAHPRGLKNLAMVDRMARLVLAGNDGTVTRN